MKKNGKKISTEYVALLGGLLLGIGLLLLDFLGAVSFLRTGISFAMDPVAYQGSVGGQVVREYLETFVKLNEFREEYNELTIQLYEQEVESSFYAVLKEENEALKKQISLGDSDQKYVMAKILGKMEGDSLRINRGEKDGVAVGDVVVQGNMYIGLVVGVDWQGSIVRLPTNKASNLEVVIVGGDLDELRKMDNIQILTKGIVRGTAEGIKIENMSMNVSLRNGDVVVVNDPRVGQYLVLGCLVGLSENPAATSRSGYVSPILDYDKLITVFVKTEL
jgi:cell shape-determining protein MreC